MRSVAQETSVPFIAAAVCVYAARRRLRAVPSVVMRRGVLSAILVGAFSCGPTTARGPQPAPAVQPVVAGETASALGRGLDVYVTAFGKHWGEASSFSGYVAVASDGKIVFEKAYGKADRERGVAADADTLFRIGSITKSFTAIGILQLEEKGLLHVDDSIRKVLPELPPFADAVTIRHCLTHTSGLPTLPDEAPLVAEDGKSHPMGAALATYKDAVLRFKPGERFEYSNSGYAILAAILERVSGKSYEAYFREHVFGPAGMAHTTTVIDPPPPHMAVGYEFDEGDKIAVAPPISYVTFGSGAILSTANDLVAFDRALADTVLLTEAAKRRMWTPDKDMGGMVPVPTRYGLGCFVSRDAGHDVFSHLGGVNGFETSFARVPDAKLTVVVLSNMSGSQVVLGRVADAARVTYLTGRSPEPVEERPVGTFADAQLAAVLGDYGIDKPSLVALRAKLHREGAADSFLGLSLRAEPGRLFMKFVGRPEAEVFRGLDGTLFTKHTGVELAVEAGASTRAEVIAISTAKHAGTLNARFVRLGTRLDPAPSR